MITCYDDVILNCVSQVNIPQVHTDKGGELMSILNLMLAQAINLQDRSGAAQIREAIRCVSLLEQVTRTTDCDRGDGVCAGHPGEAGDQPAGGVPRPLPLHRLPREVAAGAAGQHRRARHALREDGDRAEDVH